VLCLFVYSACANEYLAFLRSLKNPTLPKFDPVRAAAESKYLKNIVNLTASGTNAEAYWSFDGKSYSFQAIRDSLGAVHPCDAIYVANADGSNITLVSTGTGRTTCSYYLPDGKSVLYSSTSNTKWCPPTPDMMYGYVWPIYKDMEIYVYGLKDGYRTKLTDNNFYDAESTISPDGTRIIFTSDRDGDLELYSMNLDGTQIRRHTYTPGYDGGAWFSHNNQMLVWRAARPAGENLTDYLNLLSLGITRPSGLQIYVQGVDAFQPAVQLTSNAGTNFAPVFLPDDSGVLFSSNLGDPEGGTFQLYTVNLDGTGLTQITTEGNFNSFAMFSPDGKYLLWESDRNTKNYGDINILKAEWIGPGAKY